MTAPWQAGKTYTPGDICRPTAAKAPATVALNNPGFDTGDLTGWNIDSGTWAANGTQPYNGSWCARATQAGVTFLTNTARATVTPGLQVSASCMIRITNTSVDDNGGAVCLAWFDSGGSQIGNPVIGTVVSGVGGSWKPSTVTASAPAGAKTVTVTLGPTIGTHSGIVDFDQVTWTYAYGGPPANLIYKATQAAPGKSGATEPTWPGVTGVPVTDNQVTWEGELATRIVWEASPLMTSGATEPTWPTEAGSAVRDGTINWIGSSAQITDPNCPHSTIVAIAASKVYAGDKDIIRYCATVNPLDWTSANDAGFLDFGLQTYGANPIAAMNLYRSNIVPFNAEGFQMWQVDPDPANITLLDALPIASTYNKALAPVANDLLFLSSQGVRSVGIAASSTNLQAGDVGMPIDVLVKAAMAATAAAGDEPLSTFLPALGQFWIRFNAADRSTCTVFVYTINQIGQVGKWSRYVLPFPIDYFAMLDGKLYIRSGDGVMLYDEAALNDCEGATAESGFVETPFPGIVQWPWLDAGQPGVTKQMIGFDVVTVGADPSISFGYDETNESTFTDAFVVPADTVPGQIIPLPLMAPSMSMKISYAGGAAWRVLAANLYLQDQRPTA